MQISGAPPTDGNIIRLELTSWADGSPFIPVEMPVFGIPSSCKRFILDGVRDITRKDHALRLDKVLHITHESAPRGQAIGGPCALVTVVCFATTTTILASKLLGPGEHLLEIDVSGITRALNPIRSRDLVMQHVVLQVIGTHRDGNEQHVLSTD